MKYAINGCVIKHTGPFKNLTFVTDNKEIYNQIYNQQWYKEIFNCKWCNQQIMQSYVQSLMILTNLQSQMI